MICLFGLVCFLCLLEVDLILSFGLSVGLRCLLRLWCFDFCSLVYLWCFADGLFVLIIAMICL